MIRTLWLAACAALALVAASPAQAREAKIRGTVSAVSTTPSTVTVTDNAARSITLGLTAFTTFRDGTAANLLTGAAVDAIYEVSTRTALEIKFRPGANQAVVRGTVTALGADAATFTVTDAQALSVSLNRTAATVVTGGVLTDLTQGVPVSVKYDRVTRNATEIALQAQGELLAVVLGVEGAVISLDLTGDNVPEIALNTDASTKLLLGNATLAPDQLNLLPGMVVRVVYRNAGRIATEVRGVASPASETVGQVTAFETVARTLTIQSPIGPPNYVVASGAVVTLRGRRVSLESLRVGDLVRITHVRNGAGTNIAVEIDIVVGRAQRLNGNVASVDEAAGTLTVVQRNGAVTVSANADTDLRINGKQATLAQLAAAVTNAGTVGRTVKISGDYYNRGTQNLAASLRATVNSRSAK